MTAATKVLEKATVKANPPEVMVIDPPRTVSPEEAYRLLSSRATEPEVEDPLLPSPANRKRNMSPEEMLEFAARQPAAPKTVRKAAAPTAPGEEIPAQEAKPGAYGVPLGLNPLDQFLNRRERLTIELQDAYLTVPIIAAVMSKYSITVLAPLKGDAISFAPKPGTAVSLSTSQFTQKAYFPGAYAEIPELGIAITTYVRTES